MSPTTKGKAGNIKDLSSVNSEAALFWKTMFFCLTRPLCLLVWGITWFHLYSLCRFGRLYKNIPILAACGLWWLGVLVYGVALWRSYCKKAVLKVYDKIGQPEREAVPAKLVRWFWKSRRYYQFFLKDKRVFILDIRELDKEERDYLELKLSAVRMTGKRGWQMTAAVFLAAVTLAGAFLVGRSAFFYQGKLSWAIHDLKTKRTALLVHDNLYETGVEGILRDIRKEMELPEKLTLATSFHLHFLPDGTMDSLDTMLYGFDEDGNFIDSYLITYQADRSEKMTIYRKGTETAPYDADKDIAPLVEAVSAMPLEETVEQWKEDCYGILYYGIREWNSREGIWLLNHSGECREPEMETDYFCGYTVSVFCPENDAVTPVRYLYLGYQKFPEKEDDLESAGVGSDMLTENRAEDGMSDDFAETDSALESIVGEDDGEPASVEATGNRWRTCDDYPLEQYGTKWEVSNTFFDINRKLLYSYYYESFEMNETIPAAEKVNAFLREKEEETLAEWEKKGKTLLRNATQETDYEWGNTPNDTMTFEAITYLDEDYCSLMLFQYEYTGGVHGEPMCYAYTINLHDGTAVKIDQLADMARGKWIGEINRAFGEEQGFFIFSAGTGYEKTAGEIWYDSYEDGGYGADFYLTREGVVVYYGFGQVSWQGDGTIEVLIPWERLNCE